MDSRYQIKSEGHENTRKLESFEHDLVQKDESGREHIVVHALCLEQMQEYDANTCTWSSLTHEESREFIETLLVST